MAPTEGLRIRRETVDGAVALLCEDPSLPMVQFAFAIRYGAWADEKNQSGATHLLFELMARGTKSRSRSQFSDAFESMGSSLGVSVTNDLALFHCACLKRYFEPTAELLLEMLCEPALDEKEFHILAEECQEELRAERDEDESLVTLFFREYLYQDHLLARAPEGTVESIASLSISDLRELHQKRFHSSQHIWFFGGDFDCNSALAFVTRAAETLPGSPLSLPIVVPTQNVVPKVVVVDKSDRTQVQTRIGTPIVNGLHEDADLIWLGAVAFGGIFTSPFTREVRDIRGWSYFASATFQRRQRNIAPMILSAATSIDDVVDCLELQFELYEGLVRDGIGKEDLEHARSYLLKRYPFNFTTPESLLVPSLRNELLGKLENELFEFPSRLSSFDVELVCSSLKSNLPPKPSVAVLVGPGDNLMPRLEERFPHFDLEVVPYKQGLASG